MVNGQWSTVNGQWSTAFAQDSIRVTLLTCSPGPEVYELYGHTAIRCQWTPSSSPTNEGDAGQGASPSSGGQRGAHDLVFNYGVFDMSKPYFVWHFILGQTDYMVQPVPWNLFIGEYERRGSSIIGQELNLTPAEAHRLTARLMENSLPENRKYRYNYLFKNCTTMVRDMVEEAINGRIQYPDTLPHKTFREVLHHYTADHPWAQEGNDLLLGSGVDTILSARAAMFVPENLMRAFDDAFICTMRGDMRPLVKSKECLIPANSQTFSVSRSKEEDTDTSTISSSLHKGLDGIASLSPVQMMLAFGGLCLLILLLEVWTKRIFWLWDVMLLLLQGAAGLLLTFMFLFSQHPAVDSNWQIWVLNPIALIGIPFVIKSAIQREPTLWYAFQFALLALFLLFSPWIPQVFAKITVPLALCLLTRPVSYYLTKDKRLKSKKVKGLKTKRVKVK